MKCVNWEDAIGRPGLSLAVNTIQGTKIEKSEVEALFKDLPEGSRYLYFKGMTYARITDCPEEASTCFHKALESGLNGLQACFLRANGLVQENKIDICIHHLVTSLKEFKDPEEREPLHGKLGYVLYISRRYTESAEHYEAARSINPRAEWLNNIGCCRIRLGDIKAGKQLLDEAGLLGLTQTLLLDNKAKSELLSGGKAALQQHILSFMNNEVVDSVSKEWIFSLVSQASDMGLISYQEAQKYGVLAQLISGNPREFIKSTTRENGEFIQLGEDVEKNVFSSLYKFVCLDWPNNYISGLLKTVLTSCSPSVIRYGLEHVSVNSESRKPIAFDCMLKTSLSIQKGREDRVLENITQALEQDPEGLIQIYLSDDDLKNILDRASIAKHWVKVGEKRFEMAMGEYSRDDCFHELRTSNFYFDSTLEFYENALSFFPQDPDLLEGYADILKAIRSKNTLPKAIQFYKIIRVTDPKRAEIIIKKIKTCDESLCMLYESDKPKRKRMDLKMVQIQKREKKKTKKKRRRK